MATATWYVDNVLFDLYINGMLYDDQRWSQFSTFALDSLLTLSDNGQV